MLKNKINLYILFGMLGLIIVILIVMNINKKEVLCRAAMDLPVRTYFDYDEKNGYIKKTELLGVLASKESPYTPGTVYECQLGDEKREIFYVLEDGDNTYLNEGRIAQTGEVSLLMGRHLENLTDYYFYEEATNMLIEQTSKWTKLNSNQITLPTIQQISQVVGQEINEHTNILTLPHWMNGDNDSVLLSSYWIDSSFKFNKYWYVQDFKLTYKNSLEMYGIIPVITIQKKQLLY